MWADEETLTIGFEEASPTDWTLTNIKAKVTSSGVSAHSGSYFGNTDGKTTGSVVTKNKIASPQSITFFISKESTNSKAASWLVKVSSDGSSWTQVGDAQAAGNGITKGTWTEVTRSLSSYSDVYVGVFYDGNTAVRCIDDITITYETGGGGTPTVATPTFSVEAGTYNVAKSVTLATVTDGATIHYTIDGTDPTESSAEYSSALAVNVSTTIKAIAVKDGVSSSIATAAYELKVATPVIDPDGSVFETSQDVAITCATDGAAIYYTDDNTTPTSSSTAYSAFTLTATKTIKAIAVKSGWTDSDVATATFTKVDLNSAFFKTGLSAIAADDVIVIVGNNGSNYAMSNGVSTQNPPSAVAVSVTNNMISVVADNIKWNVSGNATDGYTFYPNGDLDNWLYCTNSNNGVRISDNDNKVFTIDDNYLKNTATSRYMGIYSSQDWRCYTTINSNITGQSFAIYKQGISMTLAEACTYNGRYYGTFSSSVPFTFPAGVTVSEIEVDEYGKLNVVDYEAGAVVPANTGVMISRATAGKVTLTPAGTAGTSVLGNDNCLKSSGFGISDAKTTGSGCKFYRLTMHNGTQIGFWWGDANGAAFSIAANKAYLAVPEERASLARSFWFDEGETTSISEVRGLKSEVRGEYFNLNGQRVAQPTKGLYIVNGRKVVIK